MKKNYKSPVTKIVTIAIQPMMASTTLDPNNPSVEVSSNSYSGTFSSRRGSFWDDEE